MIYICNVCLIFLEVSYNEYAKNFHENNSQLHIAKFVL